MATTLQQAQIVAIIIADAHWSAVRAHIAQRHALVVTHFWLHVGLNQDATEIGQPRRHAGALALTAATAHAVSYSSKMIGLWHEWSDVLGGGLGHAATVERDLGHHVQYEE